MSEFYLGNSLEIKAWRIFSRYIRMRDALEADWNGYVGCCTCGKIHFWKRMDAGHFVSRRYKNLMFCEQNNNSQCRHCNFYGSGQKNLHAQFIDKKYGAGTASILEATKKPFYKLDKFKLQAIIDKYNPIVKRLEKEVPQNES